MNLDAALTHLRREKRGVQQSPPACSSTELNMKSTLPGIYQTFCFTRAKLCCHFPGFCSHPSAVSRPRGLFAGCQVFLSPEEASARRPPSAAAPLFEVLVSRALDNNFLIEPSSFDLNRARVQKKERKKLQRLSLCR